MSLAVAIRPCEHCGTSMEGGDRFCCTGCETAAEIIRGAGLEEYYRKRSELPPRPSSSATRFENLPTTDCGDGTNELQFYIDGMRCSSCVWVTEKVLERSPGVRSVRVSYGTGRANILFDPEQIRPESIAQRVAQLGYTPRPLHLPPRDDADRDLLIRLGVAAFCASNIMLLSASAYAGWSSGMEERYATLFRWAALALATPSALYCAQPFFSGAWIGLRHRTLSMDLPVSLGIAVLYLEGITATLQGREGYLDSMAMLVALLLGGRVLEARGHRSARAAAENLAGHLPQQARRLTPTGLELVERSSLNVGDRLVLAAGEEIAADGTVETGNGRIEAALITGESEPVPVAPGSLVICGSTVASGDLVIRVTAIGADSTLEKIADELRQAVDRPPLRGIPDRIAPWFTLATLGVASATFGIRWALFGMDNAIAPTVAVLVVACPCALALAQPLAIAAALGAAARRGLLLRSGDALLRLAEVDTVVLDKTGTVTQGAPTVIDPDPAVLRLAAGLERYSIHPIAKAIVQAAIERGIPLPEATSVTETPGKGIRGTVDQAHVSLGGSATGDVRVAIQRDGPIEFHTIHLRDAIRPDSARWVAALQTLGLKVTLLSGDHPKVASAIAKAAGIDGAEGGADPLQKQARIERLRSSGRRVVFAGDGLNDGLALTAADVGIAMGTGVTAAVQAADGVILEPSLRPLEAGIRAGRAAQAAIRGNLYRSLAYNAAAVLAAAAGGVNPLVAAVLMPISSLLVIHGALGIERSLAREERQWKPSSF